MEFNQPSEIVKDLTFGNDAPIVDATAFASLSTPDMILF